MHKLLYVTAFPNSLSRGGRTIRSQSVLNSLSELYEVALATPDGAPQPDTPFDIVHVFRLAALPLARPFLNAAVRRRLDLDDIESRTHRRIEALARANGQPEIASWAMSESRRYEMLEIAAFRKFHTVFVCSETDRATLSVRCPADVRVLPNIAPAVDALPAPPSEPFRFLFIGTMDYYPNFDAYEWFCKDVLPILQSQAPRPFEVVVAGTASDSLPKRHKSVLLTGEAPDVRPLYQRAHAAIVPIRAGGGTRIKILEAFSFNRPVISTSIGAEGIEAMPDRDILLADSPFEFAQRCLELMARPELRDRLASNGLRLVQEKYSEPALRRLFAGMAAE